MIVIKSALFIYFSVFYRRLYKWVHPTSRSLRVRITACKYGLFYKWVLQQQQFIPVVQVGTIENAAVLQVGITA